MKKLFILLCVILAVSLSVSAATLEGDAQKSAEALKELDLFRGTDKGFELSRPMTRAEAAAMLVRFLGAEEKALNGSFSHPFTDVPGWADKYVGWLYQSGLTKGISNTLYGSQHSVTAWQYATFITRALKDSEEIPIDLITEEDINAIDKEKKFVRGDAAIMSIRALGCIYSKNGNWRTLADVCIERGLFTAEELGKVADEFWSTTFTIDNDGRVVRRILGIEINKTEDGGYFAFGDLDPIASDGTRIDPFIYKQDGEAIIIYAMNPKTLETTELTKREGIKGRYNYRDPSYKLGEVRFLFETLPDEDKNTVFAIKGGEMSEVLSFVNGGEFPWFPEVDKNIMTDAKSILVTTDKSYYIITENGYSEIKGENLSLIAYADGEVFAKRVNDKSTDILLLDSKTGEEKVSYNIPDDIERGEYGEGYRDLNLESEKYRYGEAGLYYYNGETLVQVTDRPVNSFYADADGSYVILTHKPGKRFPGRVHFGGNEIMRINPDGSEVYLTKEDTPFSMDGVFLKDGKVHFTTAAGIGMGHYDVYVYRIEDSGKFTVTDFSAGRPEVMNGFSWENPDAYKPPYIEAEQKRIEELGY